MNKRQSILTIATVFAFGLPGLALAETYGDRVANRNAETQSTLTRAQVAAEAAALRANPISADGLHRWAGGEVLWHQIPHAYAVRGGKLEHVWFAPVDTPARPSAQSEKSDPKTRDLYLG